MEAFIMTVGTSLLSNPDRNLADDAKRPWSGQGKIGDRTAALAWMKAAEVEQISAETNTLYHLNPLPTDAVFLLRSDTPSGQECAEVLQAYFLEVLEQQRIEIVTLPGIDYEPDSGSSLESMGALLKALITTCLNQNQAVTLAATGGFKAEAMVMAIIGHEMGIPVCYAHEQYRSIIYLPYFDKLTFQAVELQQVSLPISGRDRDHVISLSKVAHHRPKSWSKVSAILKDLPWVDRVTFNESAFNAARNSVKVARNKTKDGHHCFWIHLYDDDQHRVGALVETTGFTQAHLEQAIRVLRERLGRIF